MRNDAASSRYRMRWPFQEPLKSSSYAYDYMLGVHVAQTRAIYPKYLRIFVVAMKIHNYQKSFTRARLAKILIRSKFEYSRYTNNQK